MKKAFFLILVVLQSSRAFAEAPEIEISAGFPGGNIKVDSIVGNIVYLRPDLRDTTRDWFYWYVSAKVSKSGVIRFVFTRPHCLSRMGPAVSTDEGKSWNWLWKVPADLNEFEYPAKAGKEVRFSMGMPYTQYNLDRFLKSYRKAKSLNKEVLCYTDDGRLTERLVVGNPDPLKTRPKIVITARHHACEMMASYVLEGMIAALLNGEDLMNKMIGEFEFNFIPFMDKDGVEKGDQGKARAPRDHNRDYSGKSLYKSTAALRESFTDNVGVALDLHCPMIKGKDNEVIYFVGPADQRLSERQNSFVEKLVIHNKGTLKIDNQAVYTAEGNYDEGMSFLGWAAALPGIKLVSTIEVPYGIHKGEMITPENLRLLGRDMMYALANELF